MKTQWKVADFSYNHPDLKELWKLGYHWLYRYAAGGPPKEITKAEYDAAVKLGFGFVWAYETTAGWMEGGHPAGIAAAKDFLSKAHAIGFPPSSLYLAWDVAYPLSNAGWECARAAKSILEPVGCKTGLYVNNRFVTAAMFKEFLVHVACYGCSDSQIDKRVTIIQNQYHPTGGFPLAGGVIDENYALVEDFGQTNYGGADVPLTDKDKDELGINFAIGQQRHAEGLPRTAINPKNVKALEGWDSAEAVRVAIAKGGALPPGTKLTVTVD